MAHLQINGWQENRKITPLLVAINDSLQVMKAMCTGPSGFEEDGIPYVTFVSQLAKLDMHVGKQKRY